MSRKSPKKVLAYDLGGTKVAVGVVTEDGTILEGTRVPVVVEQGKQAVLNQLADLGNAYIAKHPDIAMVGMASAGPLDPKAGVLLDPTNLASKEGSWGQVPIAKILSQKLKRKVVLENDAAAAMLAEHWMGKAQGYDNAMILTLGTGLGTGIIANGELVRAGHHLHPEAGHMILHYNDVSAPCGCGNFGCAEAYLSGRNFSRRARTRFANPNLTAKDITELAKKRDPRALGAFEEYARLMAVALQNYAVIYCPEIVIFTGSFAEAAPIFLPKTKEHLKQMLARRREGVDLLPKLTVSSLQNEAGVLGGAYVAFQSMGIIPGHLKKAQVKIEPRKTSTRTEAKTKRVTKAQVEAKRAAYGQKDVSRRKKKTPPRGQRITRAVSNVIGRVRGRMA